MRFPARQTLESSETLDVKAPKRMPQGSTCPNRLIFFGPKVPTEECVQGPLGLEESDTLDEETPKCRGSGLKRASESWGAELCNIGAIKNQNRVLV